MNDKLKLTELQLILLFYLFSDKRKRFKFFK